MSLVVDELPPWGVCVKSGRGSVSQHGGKVGCPPTPKGCTGCSEERPGPHALALTPPFPGVGSPSVHSLLASYFTGDPDPCKPVLVTCFTRFHLFRDFNTRGRQTPPRCHRPGSAVAHRLHSLTTVSRQSSAIPSTSHPTLHRGM